MFYRPALPADTPRGHGVRPTPTGGATVRTPVLPGGSKAVEADSRSRRLPLDRLFVAAVSVAGGGSASGPCAKSALPLPELHPEGRCYRLHTSRQDAGTKVC